MTEFSQSVNHIEYLHFFFLFAEIPGPTIKNTSPANKKEDFKYSTPIEGPDNQFGSAERSDDEDERETATDISERTPKDITIHENIINRNKIINLTSNNNVNRDKLSNKVRKIINKLENTERDLQINRSCNHCCSIIVLGYVSITFLSVFLNNCLDLGLT